MAVFAQKRGKAGNIPPNGWRYCPFCFRPMLLFRRGMRVLLLEFQGGKPHVFFIQPEKIRIIAKAHTIRRLLQGNAVCERIVKEIDPAQNDVIPQGNAHFLFEAMQQIGSVHAEMIRNILHANILFAMKIDVCQHAIDQRVLGDAICALGRDVGKRLLDPAHGLHDLANGKRLAKVAFFAQDVQDLTKQLAQAIFFGGLGGNDVRRARFSFIQAQKNVGTVARKGSDHIDIGVQYDAAMKAAVVHVKQEQLRRVEQNDIPRPKLVDSALDDDPAPPFDKVNEDQIDRAVIILASGILGVLSADILYTVKQLAFIILQMAIFHTLPLVRFDKHNYT